MCFSFTVPFLIIVDLASGTPQQHPSIVKRAMAWLCDLGNNTFPLWASLSSSINWGVKLHVPILTFYGSVLLCSFHIWSNILKPVQWFPSNDTHQIWGTSQKADYSVKLPCIYMDNAWEHTWKDNDRFIKISLMQLAEMYYEHAGRLSCFVSLEWCSLQPVASHQRICSES